MADIRSLTATVRTEFGKGAARRARREGLVPVVLYGHGTDPRHYTVTARDFATVLRNEGTNAVFNLEMGTEQQLALVKQIVTHPLRDYIEHADLLVIKKGEKVIVEVSVVAEGEAAPGTQVAHEATSIDVEADAMNIPEQFVVNTFNAEAGTQITAGDVDLPEGVTLISPAETLLINVTEAARASDEDEADAEGE